MVRAVQGEGLPALLDTNTAIPISFKMSRFYSMATYLWTDVSCNQSTFESAYTALASSKAENLKALNTSILVFSHFALRKYYLHFTETKRTKILNLVISCQFCNILRFCFSFLMIKEVPWQSNVFVLLIPMRRSDFWRTFQNSQVSMVSVWSWQYFVSLCKQKVAYMTVCRKQVSLQQTRGLS